MSLERAQSLNPNELRALTVTRVLLSRQGASECGLDAPQHDLLRVAGRRAGLLLAASMSFWRLSAAA